jgi:AraC-like DNA-binding protein
MMKCVEKPHGNLYALDKPMFILVIQGAKRLLSGEVEQTFSAGQSVIVRARLPGFTRIVHASRREPYLAIAIELETTLLCELLAQAGGVRSAHPITSRKSSSDAETAVLDCFYRLMRLHDCPNAIPVLSAGIMRELHYWLLSGRHGVTLSALADPGRHTGQLASAIQILRAEYRQRLPIERLAKAAGMSLTKFHKHFKEITSLTPGQYQKRLRLVEAHRLMLDESSSARRAAREVGYKSVSQFTREYARLFQTSPRRDALRARLERRVGYRMNSMRG